MTEFRTSLASGETWVPARDTPDRFFRRFSEISEKHYSRTLTPEERAGWRQAQLAAVLDKVSSRSAFYRRHLDGADLSAVTPDDLSALPFTTKDDLRREMYDVLSGDVGEAVYFYETTGTTGRATPCPRDAKEAIASNSHVTESWRAIFAEHFGEHRPRIGLMGPTEVHSFGDTLGDIAKNVGSCNAKIWPYSPVIGFKKALELMRDLRLEVVVATPGVCLNLARAARHYGFDMEHDFDALRLFFVTGEMCTSALAANIDSVWGVSTYNILYGSQEAFVMGVAAPSRRMRFADLNYVAEIIDPETGKSLGERGTGELCVTMLVDGVKPLVRYRTGDLVRMSDDDKAVGDLPGPIIEVIGRVLDRISLGGRDVSAGEIESAVLTGITECFGYQVVIDEVDGRDRLTLRLQLRDPSADHVQMAVNALVGRVWDAFGVACDVDLVEDLDEIVSTGAFVSWKAARIKDNRRAPDAEERVAAELGRRRGITT